MTLLLLKALAFVIGHLPRSFAVLLGRALGAVAFRLASGRRRVVLENLKTAYGASMGRDEAMRIASEVFSNVATILFEFMRSPWLTPASIARHVTMEGAHHLDAALKKGRGVIVLTGHFGDWELIAPCCAHNGYPIDIVARDLDNPAINEFVKWARTRGGNRVYPKKSTMRQLIKRLRENAIVVLLIDQNVTWSEAVFVDFFGTRVAANKGPAQLALTTGAAVVPAFMTRRGFENVFVIGPELALARTGQRDDDVFANTAAFTGIIEDEVRKRPGEWFWLHRRWKTRPRDEAAPPG